MVNISTSYIKRNGKLCIFPQPGGVKALIQLIIMNKKRKNNALNCENYNNFCMTKYENQIVPAKFRSRLRTKKDQNKKTSAWGKLVTNKARRTFRSS